MMLIALLALLGVNLIVLVVFVVFVFGRKRWVSRQPGAFRGAIKVGSGEVDGLPSKWRRGYGRWVRDVLVWTKAPFLFRNEVVAIDGLEEQRPARSGEVKRLGEHPMVIRVRAGRATVEVAADAGDREQLVGPYRIPTDTTGSATPTPPGSAAEPNGG
jgi:hypothetical protein